MNRREFLWRGMAVPTVGAVVRSGASAAAAKAGSNDWDSVRQQFDLEAGKINTGLFFLASHSRVVREAIARHAKALDGNAYDYVEHGDFEGQVQAAAGKYLEVDPKEIALTDSTTMGLGLVYGSFKFAPGAEILSTEHDHYSTMLALEHRRVRDGVVVKRVPLYSAPEAANASKMVETLLKAVTPKTRMIAMTWVHSCTGVKTPVRAIADALVKINAGRGPEDRVLLSVDGVHGLGAEETTLPKLGCDIFIAGTHKWLFGPRGTGLLWMKKDVWPYMQPSIPTFSGEQYEMWMEVVPKGPLEPAMLNTPGGFHSFELRWALADAFAWHAELGKARVMARIHELNRQFKDGLSKMKHVKLHTPLSDDVSAGLNTFDVEGMQQKDVTKKLAAQNILATVTPYRPPRYPRVSFGILNSQQEVETVLKAIHGLRVG